MSDDKADKAEWNEDGKSFPERVGAENEPELVKWVKEELDRRADECGEKGVDLSKLSVDIYNKFEKPGDRISLIFVLGNLAASDLNAK